MHPADLASHRARRDRAARRALERDVGRLLPRLPAAERVEAISVADAGRTGVIPLDQAHHLIRSRISELDRAAA